MPPLRAPARVSGHSALVAYLVAPLLVTAAACGGDDGTALTTGTRTTTRPAVTTTRPPRTTTLPAETETAPEETLPIQTVPAETTTQITTIETTTEVTTTEVTITDVTTTEVTTTDVTVTRTLVTTAPDPTATAAPPPATTAAPTPSTTATPAETATTEPASSSEDDSPWAWIAAGAAAVAAALLGGLLIWRRRSRADRWSADLADLSGRTLVALDEVAAKGSVVTGQIEALGAEAAALERGAPDAGAREHAGELRQQLDELGRVLEADRSLRLSTPAADPGQLAYSEALIREQTEQVAQLLRPPPGPPPPP